MRLLRRVLASVAAVCTVGAMSAAFGSGAAGAAPAHATAKGGSDVTFAEQPGAPPTYIFPLYDGANSENADITYLQPLMWLPLYWFGHPTSSAATINYKLSMADKPVFSSTGETVTMKLEHYVWSTGTPVTARDVVFWMNLVMNEKTNYAGYVPGGWMTHVAGYSAKGTTTFVLTMNKTYNETYLLYNGLATLTPLPQQAWDKTSASSTDGTYDTTASGAKAVYSYMNSASESLSTWDTNPLWQVVDGPWHLKPTTGFQVTGQVTMIPNSVCHGGGHPSVLHLPVDSSLGKPVAGAEVASGSSGKGDAGR